MNPLDENAGQVRPRAREALDAMPTIGGMVKSKQRMTGLSWRATDVDWTFGDGPLVSGPAEALILLASGRSAPIPEVSGDGVDTLEGNVGDDHLIGFICLVKLTPFGEDVIPHEKTYKGPIEDRLKLMRATGMQLSPIFGLFSDPRNEVTGLT